MVPGYGTGGFSEAAFSRTLALNRNAFIHAIHCMSLSMPEGFHDVMPTEEVLSCVTMAIKETR